MTEVTVLLATLPERRDLIERYTLPAYHDQEGVQTTVHLSSGGSYGACVNRLLHTGWLLTDTPGDRWILVGCDDQVPSRAALSFGIHHWTVTGQLPGEILVDRDHMPEQAIDREPHGTERAWTRVFFAPLSVFRQVGPLLDLSWYVDFDFSQRIREQGWTISACSGFRFEHLDPPRGWASTEEVRRQHSVYREACVAGGRSPLI